ncbi:MAG: hypothetical protein Q4G64_05450 [bacterium]|nr:hypothetical protein [bacterium]
MSGHGHHPDEDAIVTVFGGGIQQVDTDRLRWIAARVDRAFQRAMEALVAAKSARRLAKSHHHVVNSRPVVQALDAVLGNLELYVPAVARLATGLGQAIAQYETAEHTLEWYLQNQWMAQATWRVDAGQVAHHGAELADVVKGDFGRPMGADGGYATTMTSLPPVAWAIGSMLSPFGVVTTGRGLGSRHTLPPVPFLTAALLNVTRLDQFQGNFELFLRSRSGTMANIAHYRDGSLRSGASIVGEGEGIPAIQSFSDLVDYSETLSAESKETGVGVFSAVRTENADGTASWVMVLPGMQGGLGHHNPQDNATNLQLMAHVDNDLLTGVREALLSLPIAPGEEISLVGHSQGGIIAMVLAADPQLARMFNFRHVITVGSPVGQVGELPARTKVVNLVNADDVVPGLSGLAPHTGPEQLSVIVDFDGPTKRYAHPHDWNSYEISMIAARSESGEVADLMDDFEYQWRSEGAEQAEYVFHLERTDGRDTWQEFVADWGYWVN